ncbi:MAG: Dockerin type domain [Candidatus Hydrogenedentota bacterium]|jgi:hypothetical protein
MNMATLRRDGSNMGGLVKLAGVTLSGLVAFGGAAFAQPALDITVDAPDTYTPGSTVDVTITIARTDATAADDADVTALGAEITLPSGWKVERDADANCDVAVSDNQVVGTNSTIQVKGSNQTFVDPPANTTCVAIPTTGDVLEIFWIPEDGGSGDPLPVNFPVVVSATLTVPAQSSGQQAIDGTVKYRVLEGGEVSETGGDTLEAAAGGCLTAPGDANGDNSVDPADAQLAFEAFLQIPEALAAINPDCGDFCNTGDGVDPADAQGIFNQFLQVGNPCGN